MVFTNQYEGIKGEIYWLGLCLNDDATPKSVCGRYIKEQHEKNMYEWAFICGGFKIGVYIAPNRWRVYARWPLALPFRLSQVIGGDYVVSNGVLSLPKLETRPQNSIPADSEIVKACQACHIPKIQDLLMTEKAHPNDHTPDDLTILGVSP